MPASGPGKSTDGIACDRKAKSRKPCRVAIGVEDQGIALRTKPRDDAVKDGAAGNEAHRLVAAAHPPGKSAGEQDAWRWRRAVRGLVDLHHRGEVSMTFGRSRYKAFPSGGRQISSVVGAKKIKR